MQWRKRALIGCSIVIYFFILIALNQSNFVTNALKKKIIIDSRQSKIRFFIFSCNLFSNWNDLFVSLPLLLMLKKYANSRNMALVVVGVNEQVLSYLFRNKYVNGYIYSDEIFYNRKVFLRCFSATICIKYKKIQEKRTFSNVFSYINFFSNNYTICKIEWINLVVANNFFAWLFKMTNKKNINIHVQINLWKKLNYKILFFLNFHLWLSTSKRMLIYSMNLFEIITEIGKKYWKNFNYQALMFPIRGGTKKLGKKYLIESKFQAKKINFNRKYFVVGISDYRTNTIWPSKYLAQLMIFAHRELKLQTIIIMNHSSYFITDRNWYIKEVNAFLKEQNCSFFANVLHLNLTNWDSIYEVTKHAEFTISYLNSFMTFFYHCGKSGLLIAGNLWAGILFPIPKSMLAKRQKIFSTYHYHRELYGWKSWLSKKINVIQLKLLTPNKIFGTIKKLAAVAENDKKIMKKLPYANQFSLTSSVAITGQNNTQGKKTNVIISGKRKI